MEIHDNWSSPIFRGSHIEGRNPSRDQQSLWGAYGRLDINQTQLGNPEVRLERIRVG